MYDLAKICFNLDKESKAILGILAKNGPSSQTRITRLGRRRIILSRDIIRRRISTTDLSGKDDFLSVENGKKIGNLKKVEKLYSLTLKGILASLSEVPLRENFWIRNYMNVLNEISDETTIEEFLYLIYNHIVLFLIFHSKQEGILTKYRNLEEDFYDEFSIDGPLYNLLFHQKIKGIPLDFKDTFVDSVHELFVSFYIVGNLLKKSLKINNVPENKHEISMDHTKCVDVYFRRWMWTIFSVVYNKSPQTLKLYKNDNEYDSDDVSPDIIIEDVFGQDFDDEFSLIAQDELMKIDPNLHYNSDDSLFEN